MNDDEIYNKLQFIQEAIERNNKQENKKTITRGQGRVLAILQIKDEISTNELAIILGIRKASLNETLNKLEKQNYIYKQPSPEDKRIRLVKLTQKGKTYKIKKPQNKILQTLEPKEKENLNNSLNKIIKELQLEFQRKNPEEYKKRVELRKKTFKKIFNINPECENKLLEVLKQHNI